MAILLTLKSTVLFTSARESNTFFFAMDKAKSAGLNVSYSAPQKSFEGCMVRVLLYNLFILFIPGA